MKALTIIFFISASLLFSCSSNSDRPVESAPVENTQPAATVPPKDGDGTSVHIGNDSISVGHKDGGNKTTVKITRDSIKFELNKKKK